MNQLSRAYNRLLASTLQWKPGYWGPVPYLFLVRCLIAAGILLYFGFGPVDAGDAALYGASWMLLGGTIVFAAWLHPRADASSVRPWFAVLVLADVFVVSAFYSCTKSVQSDFVLFYSLPIFTAAEYLGGRYVVAAFSLATASFAVVVFRMEPLNAAAPSGTGPILIRVFLPRVVFLLFVSLLYALRFRSERLLKGRTRNLEHRFRAIGVAVLTAVDLNEEIEEMLDQLVYGLGFEYATISLVDDYRDRIRTVRGRNVPPGWISRADHSTDSNDIQAHVFRTGETVESDEYKPWFDPVIWERFDHQRLARVFAPIVSGDRRVGVIEAGGDRSKKATLLTPANVAAVTALGTRSKDIIARGAPRVLLEDIAKHALEIIGADSASIHVSRSERRLFIAGAGRVDKGFLHRHPPSPDGIGSRALRAGKPQIERSPRAELTAEGIVTMAAFPLSLGVGTEGLLYIHYWRPHIISESEMDLIGVFVPHIEAAIQNLMVFQGLSEDADKDSIVTGLRDIIKSLSAADLPRLLDQVASNVLYMLDAQNVTLYQYSQPLRRFIGHAVTKGPFKQRDLMRMEVNDDDIVQEIVATGKSRFISDAEKQKILTRPRADSIERPRFVQREGIKSCAILVLKSPHENEIVGCLFANFTERKDFEGDATRTLRSLANSIASSAAVAIQTARRHEDNLRQKEIDLANRNLELQALRNINRAISESATGPNLAAICTTLLKEASTVLGAVTGDLSVWNPIQKKLEVLAHHGYPAGGITETVTLGEGIVGWVGKYRRTLRVDDVSEPIHVEGDVEQPVYRPVNKKTKSELAVPLIDGETLLGVLNVEQPRVNGFSDANQTFLETLAIEAIIAMHSVGLYRKLQEQLQQSVSLSTIAARIQSTQGGLEQALRQLLTGVTAEEGLAFSRAMLFVADDDGQALSGALAIGARDSEEANDSWRRIKAQSVQLETPAAKLAWHLAEAEKLSQAVAANPLKDSPLSLDVRAMSLPAAAVAALLPEFGSGAPTRVRIVDHVESAPLRRLLPFAYDNGEECATACVAIKTPETTLGLLVTDRRFLSGQEKIDPICAPQLAAYAELTAITIESARLRVRLADQKQLESWREKTARIAHMFKAPIHDIEAQVRVLADHLALADLEGARQARDKLARRLSAVGALVTTFTRYARETPLELSRVNLSSMLAQLVQRQQNALSCTIEIESPPEHVFVMGNEQGTEHVFNDLFVNAARALRKQKVVEPKILVKVGEDDGQVVVEVSDNGPGVAQVIEERVFEPFVTTETDNSGLGLSIIHDLVRQHGGTIGYRNADGACFTVRLPRAGATLTQPAAAS